MEDYLVDIADVSVPSCYPFPEDMPYPRLEEFREIFFSKVQDSSQCLLLMGPRGAGKTTFLRSCFSSSVRLRLFSELTHYMREGRISFSDAMNFCEA